MKQFAKSFSEESGFGLISVLIAVGIVGILAASMARLMSTNYKAANDVNTIASYSRLLKYIDDRVLCKETVDAIVANGGIAANCTTTQAYVDLIQRDINGDSIPDVLIDEDGGIAGEIGIRARCYYDFPSAGVIGLDLRFAHFGSNTIANTALSTPGQMDFNFPSGSYTDKSNTDNHLFKTDIRGHYLTWSHPRAQVTGELIATEDLFCKSALIKAKGGSTIPKSFGGVFMRRLKALWNGAEYVHGPNMDPNYCREPNPYTGGCSCPTGYSEHKTFDLALPYEVPPTPPGGYAGSRCREFYYDESTQCTNGTASSADLGCCGIISYICLPND